MALTYDDGPGRELTARVLDLLAEERVRATFFASAATPAPGADLLDRARADGHEIGCHTHDHRHAWKTAPWTAVRDIERGFATLAPWVPRDGLFRPPHGKLSAPTLAAVGRRRAPLCWWTHDSGDTHATLPDPERVAHDVVAAGGGVVLLHDFDRWPAQPDRERFVLDVTAAVVRDARGAGLALLPLGERSTPVVLVCWPPGAFGGSR